MVLLSDPYIILRHIRHQGGAKQPLASLSRGGATRRVTPGGTTSRSPPGTGAAVPPETGEVQRSASCKQVVTNEAPITAAAVDCLDDLG